MATIKPHGATHLTEGAFQFQCRYLQGAAKEKSMASPIKTSLIGRAIVFTVVLLLHADVICGAVRVCFYWLKQMLCQSNGYLLKSQKHRWDVACKNFSMSLQGLFQIQILIDYTDPNGRQSVIAMRMSPRNPRDSSPREFNLPDQIDEEAYPAPASPTGLDWHNVSPRARPEESADDYLNVSPRPNPPTSPFSEVSDGANACRTPQRKSPNLHLDLPDAAAPEDEVSEPLSPFVLDLDLSVDPNIPDSDATIEQLLETAEDQRPRSAARSPRGEETEQKEPELELQLDQQEQHLIALSQARAAKRRSVLEAERKPLDEKTVTERLSIALRDAKKQIYLNESEVPYRRGSEEHYHDPLWTFKKRSIEDMCEVGFCQYVTDPLGPKTHALVDTLQAKIGQDLQHGCVFGIFDPQLGQRAARYFQENLKAALQKNLEKYNPDAPSVTAIYNAISLTFVELDDAFTQNIKPLLPEALSNQKTSATVGIIFNDILWIAHVGNSRSLLSFGAPCTQLSEDPDPMLPKYKEQVEARGGAVDRKGRINDTSDLATGVGYQRINDAVSSQPVITATHLESICDQDRLFLGTREFFDLTSSNKIGKLIKAHPELDPDHLAHDLVYSAKCKEANKRFAGLVVKFNNWVSF